jgi:hypothetical protein
MACNINESDWKKFRDIHATALARFTERCLSEIQYHLTDKSKPASERFWEIVEITQKRRRDVNLLFDDFRRSTALMQLAAMRHRKLVTDVEMARFSDETQALVKELLKING